MNRFLQMNFGVSDLWNGSSFRCPSWQSPVFVSFSLFCLCWGLWFTEALCVNISIVKAWHICSVFHFLHKIIITPSAGTQVFIQVIVCGNHFLSIPHGTNKQNYMFKEMIVYSNTIWIKMIINLIKYIWMLFFIILSKALCVWCPREWFREYKTQRNVSHLKSSAIFYILILSTSFHDMTSS